MEKEDGREKRMGGVSASMTEHPAPESDFEPSVKRTLQSGYLLSISLKEALIIALGTFLPMSSMVLSTQKGWGAHGGRAGR